MTEASAPTLPAGMLAGVELFNQGHFYKAHEVMEEAWRSTPGPERLLYQGLIQAAVTLWRVERGDLRIALTMCSRALPKLAAFRPAFAGVDVEALYSAMERVRDVARQLGEDRIGQFDRRLFPRVRFV